MRGGQSDPDSSANTLLCATELGTGCCLRDLVGCESVFYLYLCKALSTMTLFYKHRGFFQLLAVEMATSLMSSIDWITNLQAPQDASD
jgi:hypothetical protein